MLVNVEAPQQSANTNQRWHSSGSKTTLHQNEGPGREKQDRVTLNLPDPCNLIELLGGLPEIIYVPVFYKL